MLKSNTKKNVIFETGTWKEMLGNFPEDRLVFVLDRALAESKSTQFC